MRLFHLIFLFIAHCLTHISAFSEADELAVDAIPSNPEYANTEANGLGAGQQQGDWTDTQNKLNQQFGANLMPGPVLLDEETAKRLSESEKDKVDDAMNKEIDTANVDNPAVQVPVQETVPHEAAENSQINENVKPVSNIDVPNNPVVLQGQVENGVPIVPIGGTVNNPVDTAAYLNLPAAINPVDTYAPKDLQASYIETVNNNDNNVNAQQTQLGNQMMSQQSFENPGAGNPGLSQSALQNNLEDTTVHEMNNQQPQSQGAVEYPQKNLFQLPQKPEQNIVNERQPQIQSQMAAQQDIGMNNNLINAPQSQGLDQGIPQMNDPNTAGTNPLLNDNVEGNRIYDQQAKINAEGAAVQGNVANIPSPILPAYGAILPQQNQQVVPAAGVPQGSNDNNTNTLQSENVESKPSENIVLQPVPLVPASGFGVQGAESQAAINQVMPYQDNSQANVPQGTIGNPNMQEPGQAMPNQGAPVGTGVQMPVQGVVPQETVGSPAIKETVQAVPGQGAIDGIQMTSQETVGSPDKHESVQAMPDQGAGAQMPVQGGVPQETVGSPDKHEPVQAMPDQGTGAQMPVQGGVPQETVGSPDKHEPVQAMPDQGTGVQMPVQGGVPQGDTNESAAPVEFRTTTPLSSTEATTKWDTTKLDRYLNNTDNADAGRQDTDYDYKGDDDDANFDEFDNGNDMDNDDLDDGFYGDDDADADDDDLFDDMDADANDENLDAWKNWQAKDDNDINDFGDQDTDRWPERASTEQSSTASVETDRFGVDGVQNEEAARFKQPFMDDESYARKMASHNMGFDDQLYGNEPTISVYSWILFFLLLFLTLSFFAYWSRHRVFAYIRQAQGRRSSGSSQYRREESKSLLKHEIA